MSTERKIVRNKLKLEQKNKIPTTQSCKYE